jgi:hypothetical protein
MRRKKKDKPIVGITVVGFISILSLFYSLYVLLNGVTNPDASNLYKLYPSLKINLYLNCIVGLFISSAMLIGLILTCLNHSSGEKSVRIIMHLSVIATLPISIFTHISNTKYYANTLVGSWGVYYVTMLITIGLSVGIYYLGLYWFRATKDEFRVTSIATSSALVLYLIIIFAVHPSSKIPTSSPNRTYANSNRQISTSTGAAKEPIVAYKNIPLTNDTSYDDLLALGVDFWHTGNSQSIAKDIASDYSRRQWNDKGYGSYRHQLRGYGNVLLRLDPYTFFTGKFHFNYDNKLMFIHFNMKKKNVDGVKAGLIKKYGQPKINIIERSNEKNTVKIEQHIWNDKINNTEIVFDVLLSNKVGENWYVSDYGEAAGNLFYRNLSNIKKQDIHKSNNPKSLLPNNLNDL